MAHKTFISYKYSEARSLRDKIINSLGEDARYYSGETSDSPNKADTTTQNIKRYLKDMMYGTSVTIVILSPNMKDSDWIEWEIEYSLKRVAREGRKSQTNGLVGVIMKVNGDYGWLEEPTLNCHGNPAVVYNSNKLPNIINANRYNSRPPRWHCSKCRTYDSLGGSYISFIKEDIFLDDPTYYIENAYQKSENDGSGFDLTRSII